MIHGDATGASYRHSTYMKDSRQTCTQSSDGGNKDCKLFLVLIGGGFVLAKSCSLTVGQPEQLEAKEEPAHEDPNEAG